MAKAKQISLLRRPPRLRKAKPMVLRRATKDCAVCSNWRGRLDGVGNRYLVKCQHKGRRYVINGAYEMTVCICCVRPLLRQGNTVKEKS